VARTGAHPSADAQDARSTLIHTLALRAQGHAATDTLVVRPPVVLGVLVLTRLPTALGADQRLVGHAADASPAGEWLAALQLRQGAPVVCDQTIFHCPLRFSYRSVCQ
jgi:hypothetical protein